MDQPMSDQGPLKGKQHKHKQKHKIKCQNTDKIQKVKKEKIENKKRTQKTLVVISVKDKGALPRARRPTGPRVGMAKGYLPNIWDGQTMRQQLCRRGSGRVRTPKQIQTGSIICKKIKERKVDRR